MQRPENCGLYFYIVGNLLSLQVLWVWSVECEVRSVKVWSGKRGVHSLEWKVWSVDGGVGRIKNEVSSLECGDEQFVRDLLHFSHFVAPKPMFSSSFYLKIDLLSEASAIFQHKSEKYRA